MTVRPEPHCNVPAPDLDWQSGFLSGMQNAALPASGLQNTLTPGFVPGFSLYRDSQRSLRRQVLSRVYPVLQQLLGDACFYQLCDAFSFVTPSLSGDLHIYGAGLDAYMRASKYAPEYPYLTAVAELEWCLHTLYYAENPELLSLPLLVAKCEGDVQRLMQARLKLSVNARLLKTQGNIAEIWLRHQNAELEGLRWSDEPRYAVISRPQWVPLVTEISLAEYHCLTALSEGQALAQALLHMAEGTASGAEACLTRIAAWIALGVFDA